MEMTKRHRESLEVLRKECDYEDSRVKDGPNFILWHQKTGSSGEKTRAELIDAGFATAGQHRWSDAVGYRITDLGRAALATPLPAKVRRPSGLKEMPSTLKPLRGRLDRAEG